MNYLNLAEELASTTYPGRGIVLGRSQDGKKMVIAYFIMGRSENSRNRVFVEQEGGIRTEAFDPAKLADPSLIIYAPVRVLGAKTIVTNGDQTDTIYDFIKDGKTFEEALRTSLKSNNGDPESNQRYFFEYENPKAGQGHFIHTYRCDGNPIPSYEGEPTPVIIEGDIDAFTAQVWDNLNEDNKVSLFTRFIDLESGETQTRIINKNK